MRGVVIVVCCVLVVVSCLFADVPRLISYQGRLTNASGVPITGSHNITFRLYTVPSGGTAIWTETQTLTLNSEGLYNAMLGSVTPFPSSVDFSQQYYLGVSVDGGSEICRYQLGSSPYTLNLYSLGAANGQVLKWNSSLQKWEPRNDSIGVGTITGSGTDNYIPMWNGTSALENSVIYQDASGRLQIGAPSYTGAKINIAGGSLPYALNAEFNGSSFGAAITATNSGTAGDAIQANVDGSGRSAIYARANSSAQYAIYANANGAPWASYSLGNSYFSGDVGIGTTSLNGKLTVAGAITPSANQSYDLGSSDYLWKRLYVCDRIDGRNALDYTLYFYSNGGYFFKIDDDNDGSGTTTTFAIHSGATSNIFLATRTGNVGIGTGNPAARLHAVTTSGPGLRIESMTGSGASNWNTVSSKGTGVVMHIVADSSIHRDGVLLLTEKSDSTSCYFIRCDSYTGGWHPVFTVEENGKTICTILQITGGSDIAEPFDIADDEVKPGMVMVIDPDNPGKLKVATEAYDSKVAGIVSGAGGINPGMVMGQTGSMADGEHPIAISGRVYCYADATYGPIRPGDLLTTSSTPGHVMKVTDFSRAQGAIVGKAMTGLESGTGLILVLVSLQ